MPPYIHELKDWPNFRYDSAALLTPLTDASRSLGQLVGRLEGLGFTELQDAKLEAISAEVVQSSAIEGEQLNPDDVRSSIARRLGMTTGGIPSSDHRLEGVVEMAIDAADNASNPLTKERLVRWHAGLFPGGWGPHGRVRTGNWRDDAKGPMQVVSRAGTPKEKVHFQAPPADRIAKDVRAFLTWFERDRRDHPILKAGLSHLWFESIHPFDDGNGRIGRAILDMALARADQQKWRCYSVSSQIRKARNDYYNALERAEKGTLDATHWLTWYLGCLQGALDSASETISAAIERTRFWKVHEDTPFNPRQRKMLTRMLMGWEGKMTPRRWAQIFDVDPKTAQRDMVQLVDLGVFEREDAGRSTSYQLLNVGGEE